jgi:hypothetical protein
MAKTTAPGKVGTSISVDKNVLKTFKMAMLDREDVSQISEAIEIAMKGWIQGSFSAATSTTSGNQSRESYTSSGEGARSAENERYHEMLDRILDAGGTYRAAIIANLEGWSRAVRLEDRESEQVTRDPETEQSGAAGALAYADSALQRAKADREGTLRDEKSPVKRIAKRRTSGSRNSQR